MNFGELKTELATESHRTDLTDLIPGFIESCEGMIRRELQQMSITVTLDEDDRASVGTYNLPTGAVQVRAIHRNAGTARDVALEKVGLHQLRSMSTAANPLWFADRAANQIEIRGTPATDQEFTLEYLGVPTALSADADTNSLLTNHKALYVEGSLFYLYKHLQDVELAQAALDTFNDVVKKLNEQYGRKVGGASIAGAYNLYGGNSSY